MRRITKRQRQQGGPGSQQIQVAGDLVMSGVSEAKAAGKVQELLVNNFASVGAATVPGLLPRDVPNFIGREDELAGLGGLVGVESSSKVALINGAAGVGKTALAVHAAHLLLPQFPDGQLYADMRGYTDGQEPAEPGDVLVSFLQQLHAENAEIPAMVLEQSGLLRSLLASKRVLMLLDNVANEAQVRPLLPGAGSSLTLITSRSPLMALEIDRRIDLDVLSREDATRLLEGLIGQERTQAEPEATAQVRDWCARLPLALWIAGQLLAVHKTWPVSRLADMLADERQRLDRLAAGDRQVRAAFQASYLQLADADALMFRLLGLHQGSAISISIAAGLAGIDDRATETILERLVVAHLVVEDEVGRYVMHDLIRLFSREICRMMTSGSGEALGLPTPLARLYAMAMHGSINVSVYDDSDEPWPDSETAALASYDGIVILNPSLDDDLRADVLAFAIAVCCSIVIGDTAPEGRIAAPDGYVAIGRERLPEPPNGPGRLAKLFARQCGRDIDSATFSVFSGFSKSNV
jgi:hypothetical protein